MNNKAFTLIETIITLAIIGIIAVLTIPSLIKTYEKHVIFNQLKTNYALLLQANKMAIDNGASLNYNDYTYNTRENSQEEWFVNLFNVYSSKWMASTKRLSLVKTL